ncbi:Asialoglycoprotein receptor 1 [Liparis tanakae]|uniref:Asialoglycoprotein receptor 1 n=1 Tax=Liparis tanakae TaxID=230148 RepID=A0A4Z2E538_9TELE|nr:Asialoglycoprotein receptor 1 [Liparis tanakae]
MNWADAQRYCREKYIDLATFESVDDVRMVTAGTDSWIGLHDDPQSWKDSMGNDTNSWRWSATGETSKTGYQRWAPNEPAGSEENEMCAQMLATGEWDDYGCEARSDLSFVCYTGEKLRVQGFYKLNVFVYRKCHKYCSRLCIYV